MQDEFKRELDILVDIPLSGFGSTNDGNTARKFFSEYVTTSKITLIPEDLIKRFYVITSILSGSVMIELKTFTPYVLQTARLLRKKFPKKNFTPTVHKMLYHSTAIITHFNTLNLPIGVMSEEALESRNKDIRNFRKFFARKNSRVNNITDVFNHLMIT